MEDKFCLNIKNLIEQGETECVEFKSHNTDPNLIGQYLSGLSNSACLNKKIAGYLIYGVEDNGEITGTIYNPSTEKIGNEDLEKWLARYLQPQVNLKVRDCVETNRRVVVFEVGSAIDQPVKFQGKAFVRIGSNMQPLDSYPEKARQIWLNRPHSSFENQSAMEELEADEVLNILEYPAFFELNRLVLPDNKNQILSKMSEYGLVRVSGAQYEITNLGAILYAKNLDEFSHLINKSLRVIQYQGINKNSASREYPNSKGYAVSFMQVIDTLKTILPLNEEIKDSLRKETPLYPEVALRELIANALVHQDFSQLGSHPLVEIYEDRIEVSNPGVSLVETDRFIDSNSESRNEKLAKHMRDIGICEQRGSGVDKVVSSAELFQLPAPDFQQLSNHIRAILYKPRRLLKMSKEEKIRACYQHACLQYVSGSKMTNSSIRKRFGIKDGSHSMASTIINNTLESGKIKLYETGGSPRDRKYVPYFA